MGKVFGIYDVLEGLYDEAFYDTNIITDSVSLQDSKTLLPKKVVTNLINLNESLKIITKAYVLIGNKVDIADNVSFVYDGVRTKADSVVLVDEVSKNLHRVLSDAYTLDDAVSSHFGFFSATINLNDSLTKKYSYDSQKPNKFDQMILKEDLIKNISTILPNDVLVLQDEVSKKLFKELVSALNINEDLTINTELDDSSDISLSDTIEKDISITMPVLEQTNLNDVLTKNIKLNAFTGTYSLSELNVIKAAKKVLSDTITIIPSGTHKYILRCYSTGRQANSGLALSMLKTQIETINSTDAIHYLDVEEELKGFFTGVIIWGETTGINYN